MHLIKRCVVIMQDLQRHTQSTDRITALESLLQLAEELRTTVTRLFTSSSSSSSSRSSSVSYLLDPKNLIAFTNTLIYLLELISGLHADNEWYYLLRGGHCGAAERQAGVCVCVETGALS